MKNVFFFSQKLGIHHIISKVENRNQFSTFNKMKICKSDKVDLTGGGSVGLISCSHNPRLCIVRGMVKNYEKT